jgi:hypothetical protein
MLAGTARLAPTDGPVDVLQQLWGRDARNSASVKMLVVFKRVARTIRNSDDIAPAVTERFDNVLVAKLEVEMLRVAQQFEVIQSTNILLIQTGTGSLTLGVLMAPGNVLIEVLESVGMNHSVSSAGWFFWPSVPYIHVRSPLPIANFDLSFLMAFNALHSRSNACLV